MHFPQDFAIQKNLTPFISLKFNLKKFVYMYTLYRDFHRQGSFPHFFNVRT